MCKLGSFHHFCAFLSGCLSCFSVVCRVLFGCFFVLFLVFFFVFVWLFASFCVVLLCCSGGGFALSSVFGGCSPCFLFAVVASPLCPVAALFGSFSSFGFSGSRSVPSGSVGASLSSSLSFACSLVPSGSVVSVGCAAGIDAVASLFFASRPSAFRLSVFSVSGALPSSLLGVVGSRWSSAASAASSGFSCSVAGPFVAPSFPARLASRSSACVRSVVAAGGLWCSFPSVACPSRVRPSRSWCSSGSGSWSSLALAAGLGCSVVVCLPVGASFSLPSWVGGSWVRVGSAVGCGSFFRWVASPVASPPPSLF